MTENKKESVIQAVKGMAEQLNQAKKDLKDAVNAADDAASRAEFASDRAYQLVESVGEAERKLRQLMDLLDEEVRP